MEKTLRSVLGSFVDSYAGRDKAVAFPDWLAGRLRQEMPGMSEEAGRNLAEEIMEAVAGYSGTLKELNAAVDAGQSREGWFADRLAEAYDGMPDDAVGEKLQEIEGDIYASNGQLMHGIDPAQTEDVHRESTGKVEWNQDTIRDKALRIGKQFLFSGMAVAANVVKNKTRKGEAAEIRDVIGEALQDGLHEDPEEVKAVVAGAVKAAAKDGLTDIQEEAIGDVAGAVVESAEALYDAACGKSSMDEAQDKVGRATLAAGARHCIRAVKGALSRTPVGALVVELVGGVFDYMQGPEFTENVYPVVKKAAVKAWDGIKKVGKGLWNAVKKTVFG